MRRLPPSMTSRTWRQTEEEAATTGSGRRPPVLWVRPWTCAKSAASTSAGRRTGGAGLAVFVASRRAGPGPFWRQRLDPDGRGANRLPQDRDPVRQPGARPDAGPRVLPLGRANCGNYRPVLKAVGLYLAIPRSGLQSPLGKASRSPETSRNPDAGGGEGSRQAKASVNIGWSKTRWATPRGMPTCIATREVGRSAAPTRAVAGLGSGRGLLPILKL